MIHDSFFVCGFDGIVDRVLFWNRISRSEFPRSILRLHLCHCCFAPGKHGGPSIEQWHAKFPTNHWNQTTIHFKFWAQLEKNDNCSHVCQSCEFFGNIQVQMWSIFRAVYFQKVRSPGAKYLDCLKAIALVEWSVKYDAPSWVFCADCVVTPL